MVRWKPRCQGRGQIIYINGLDQWLYPHNDALLFASLYEKACFPFYNDLP